MALPIQQLPGIGGGVYLGVPNFFVMAGVISGVDSVEVLARPKTLPANLIGTTIYLQGYTVSGSPAAPHLTNMVGVEFK